MDKLEQLLALIEAEKQEEAKKIIDELKDKREKSEKTIKEFESKKNELEKKVESKAKEVVTIKDILGASAEQTPEEIKELVEKLKKPVNDETIKIAKADNEKLKEELKQKQKEIEEVKAKSRQEIIKAKSEKEILDAAIKWNAKKQARSFIVKDVLEKLTTTDEGKIKIKDTDGTTLRIDGEDATIDAYIGQLFKKEKEDKESFLFNIENQKSGSNTKEGEKKKSVKELFDTTGVKM